MSFLPRMFLALFVSLVALVGVHAEPPAPTEPAAPAAPAPPPVTLAPGDPAPPLKVAKWIKGEPVKEIEKGKVYVLAFWASWSQPSTQFLPELSELQKEYPEALFIAMNCWEKNPADAAKVVEQGGKQIDCRVGLDNGVKGAMTMAWMEAVGRKSIPVVFIVDKSSRLAWVGNPLSLERKLKRILSGKYDIAIETKSDAYMAKISAAIKNTDVVGAESLCDAFEQELPEKAGIVAHIRFGMAKQKTDVAEINRRAATAFDVAKDEPEVLSQVALALADPDPDRPGKDLDLALKMSLRAVELTKSQDVNVLTIAAKVCFIKENVEKAIELQTLALERAKPRAKAKIQEVLNQYLAAKKK